MMNLHRAIGRLITGKTFGLQPSDEVLKLISEGTISGVTLFKDNAAGIEQLVALVHELRRHADNEFLISVDQEGGAIQRFDHVIAPLPSAMALAALKELNTARSLVRLHALELRLLGINCNLVPVLDINSNPLNPIIGTRSFGDDLSTIIGFGAAIAKEYTANGILCSAKHFPGHGDTSEDSHLKLVVVDKDRETLQSHELAPFVACAPDLPSMLVAHVWVPAFDKERMPATLSPNVVTSLLRDDLGYGGFLMTDDMPGMKAIADNWGLEEASIRAIKAGMDHLLMCGTAEQLSSVHTALVKAVESGAISESRIEESLKRRNKAVSACTPQAWASRGLKGGDTTATPPADKHSELRQVIAEASKLASETSARAIHVARGSAPNLTAPNEWVLIVPQHPRYSMNLLDSLAADKAANRVGLHERRYSFDPNADEIRDVVTFTAGRRCIFLTFRALLNKGQLALSEALSRSLHQDSVLVATDVPYELKELTSWKNAMAVFDPSDGGMKALAQVLLGRIRPVGKCPVRLTMESASGRA